MQNGGVEDWGLGAYGDHAQSYMLSGLAVGSKAHTVNNKTLNP